MSTLIQKSPPTTIVGEIVKDWREFGHHFKIEKLPEPRRIGAGLRYYRLWDNGYPASGGQWHYTFDGAVARADYCLQGEYSSRITWLEMRVNDLQRDLFHAQQRRIYRVKAIGRRVAA